jgi:hypothetical protein
MLNPDSEVFQKWQQIMATGQMTGTDRPVGRVTWCRNKMAEHFSGRPGPWRSLQLQNNPREHELPNVLTLDLNLSLGDDANTCSMVVMNDSMPGFGYSPVGDDTGIGRPGFMTFNRGDKPAVPTISVYAQMYGDTREFPTDWDYPYSALGGNTSSKPAAYYNLLIPNRVLKTYQGYGSDNFDPFGNHREVDDPLYVAPADDTQIVQTGVWLIDKATYSDDGTIKIECRDLAKLLIEQVVYPPMLPMSRFPLTYCPVDPGKKASGHKEKIGANVARGYDACSNDPWYGRGAVLYGHKPHDAFDGHPGTYWLSVGNASPNAGYSFEWMQTSVKSQNVNEVVLRTKGTGYTCFVSVMENGVWKGTDVVPYVPDVPPAFPNGANIPYVTRTTIGTENEVVIKLPRVYKAQKVRVCFTNLWDSGLGPYTHRAAVREFRVRYHEGSTFKAGRKTNKGKPGIIEDWSEAVKELCGWAGFTWAGAPSADPLLGTDKKTGQKLAVWGDFEELGTGPIVCTMPDFFLNKTFMDCINLIKQFFNNVFWIDESGGAIFQQPNIWSMGNFVHDPSAPESEKPYIQEHPIEFHENANLMKYSVTIDDTDVRSEVLVVAVDPLLATVPMLSGGYDMTDPTNTINFSDVLGGQTRLMMVPPEASKGLVSDLECQRMAELTALFILFTYRKGTISAPAHPGLQLDDQIRVYERLTYENNIHYVSAINTHMDLISGEYTMDVTCNWLGTNTDKEWFTNKIKKSEAVLSLPAILHRLGTFTQADNSPVSPFGQLGSDT